MEKREEQKGEKETKESPEKEQIKSESKALRNFFIVVVLIAGVFLATWFLINSTKQFTYNGVKFYIDTSEVKGLTMYRTTVPVGNPATGQVVGEYRFFLYTDPRVLNSSVPIEGNIIFPPNIVIDKSVNNFSNCGSDSVVAMGELVNYLNRFNTNITVANSSLHYDPPQNYMFLVFNKANSTKITQIEQNAYEVDIKNCEILPAMERIILERFVQYKNLGI
jgi:hypothetical protein